MYTHTVFLHCCCFPNILYKKITFVITVQLLTYLLHAKTEQPRVFSIDSLKITRAH